MTRFLHWRKMTWVILLWSSAMTAWVIVGGAVATSALLWSFVFVFLTGIWFVSRPLWRQGHGARLRRLRVSDNRPVRSFERLSTRH